MKKLSLAVLLILAGCKIGNDAPSCSDEKTKKALQKILIGINQNQAKLAKRNQNAVVAENYVSIDFIRTIDTNTKTGAHLCAAVAIGTKANGAKTDPQNITYSVEKIDGQDQFLVTLRGWD